MQALARHHGDFVQRAHHAFGLAGKLHRRSIGQKFALAANRRLYPARQHVAEAADQHQQPAQKRERQRHHTAGHRRFGLVGRCVAARFQTAFLPIIEQIRAKHQPAGAHGNQLQAKQPAGEAHIQAHIAIGNVAEFMRHHRLQLGAVELLQRAAGNTDHSIGRRGACGKSIDAAIGQKIHFRHRHHRRQRHFFHHIHQPPLGRRGRRIKPRTFQRFGHHLAAARQFAQTPGTRAQHQRRPRRSNQPVLQRTGILAQKQPYRPSERRHRERQGRHIKPHQPQSVAPCLRLPFKKPHQRRPACLQTHARCRLDFGGIVKLQQGGVFLVAEKIG